MKKLVLKGAFLVSMFFTTGWSIDNAVIQGRIVDSTDGAPVTNLRVAMWISLPVTPPYQSTKTDASGKYAINIPGSEIEKCPNYNSFIIRTDTCGGLQYQSIEIPYPPPGANKNDGKPDTITSDIKVPKVPGPYDTIVITGKVTVMNYLNVKPPNIPVKIRWKRYQTDIWDTLIVKTNSEGVFLYSAPNRFVISKVYSWVDTLPNYYIGSKLFYDTLPAPVNFFDGKKDTIAVKKELGIKSLIPVVIKNSDGPMPGFGPGGASRVSVSFYSLNGRLIHRAADVSTDRIAALAARVCPSPSHILIAVWRENGKPVSRRILPATR